MSKRLVQLIGDGCEELWYFPEETTNEEIERLYSDWLEFDMKNWDKEGNEIQTFEDYVDHVGTWKEAERVFVDEIYV